MAAILYLLTAVLCLALARRVAPVSLRAGAALVALPLLFTGSALLTARIYAPIDLAYTAEPLASLAREAGVTHVANAAASDVYAQFVPWNAALRWAIAHHEWPLWNPFELGGDVLAAAAQSAPYHPLTLIALLLPQGQALTYAAAMLFFVAALSLFLLARDLELGELASFFGAAAWAFSTHVVTFAHTAHGNAVAMTPFVLLASRRVAREPRPRSAALLLVALTLLMLCGHPESMLHVVLLGGVFGLLEIGRVDGGAGRAGGGERRADADAGPAPRSLLSARRSLAYALGAGVVTLALCAIFILPLFDAIGQTREFLHRTSATGSGRHASTLTEVADALPKQFVPFVEGKNLTGRHLWTGSGYAGALAFAPALYALWRARRRATWFFAAVVVFGWLIGAEMPGLADLFFHLPLFSIAINARMISFAALGTAMLAAIGIDAWLRSSKFELRTWETEDRTSSFELRRSKVDDRRSTFGRRSSKVEARSSTPLLGATAVAMIAAIVMLIPSMLDAGLTQNFIRVNASRAVLPLILGFALCRVLAPRPAAVALIALLLLQRSGEAGGLQPTLDAKAFYPPIAGLDSLPRDETQPYRIAGQGTLFTPDIAAHYGLEDVRGYQAMTFARLAATFPLWCQPQPVWSNRVDDLTAPMLSLMNVRYALATPHSATPAGWTRRGSYQGFELLENEHVLPRAFLPATVHEGIRPQDVVEAMQQARDLGASAWIEGGEAKTVANGTGRIALRRRGSHLRMEIDMDAPGWVVVSEPAWRGWRAFDRGRPLDLRFADSAFLAFHLDRGSHDVRLFYRPASFVLGSSVTAATALLLLATWVILRRRRNEHGQLLGPGSPRPAARAVDGHR